MWQMKHLWIPIDPKFLVCWQRDEVMSNHWAPGWVFALWAITGISGYVSLIFTSCAHLWLLFQWNFLTWLFVWSFWCVIMHQLSPWLVGPCIFLRKNKTCSKVVQAPSTWFQPAAPGVVRFEHTCTYLPKDMWQQSKRSGSWIPTIGQCHAHLVGVIT